MPTLCSSSPVHEQGQERGYLSVSRTGPRDPSSSLDRVGEHLCPVGCEREDRAGQVYGDSRSTSFDHRTRQVGNEPQGQRGEGSSFACDAQDGGEEESVSTAYDYNKVRGGQHGILESCEQPTSGGGNTNRPSEGSSSKGTPGWPVSMGEKIGNLWSSLQSLRHRMGTQEKGCQSKHDTDTTILNTCTTTNSNGEASMNGNVKPEARDCHVCLRDGDIDELKDQSTKRSVVPFMARRLAYGAAAIGAAILQPAMMMMNEIDPRLDLMEVACAPTSSLSQEFINAGYECLRVNYKSGYDLDRRAGTSKTVEEMNRRKPRLSWISLPCTRLTPLQNLTPRTDAQWEAFARRQQMDLRRAREVATGVGDRILEGDDFAWEWPSGASKGWKSKAIQHILKMMHKAGRRVYWCRLDGCAFGLHYFGQPILKGWTILTSSRHLYLALGHRCQGGHDHVECRGKVAQASSYYPPAMVKAALKGMIAQWSCLRDGTSPMEDDLMYHLQQPREQDQLHAPHASSQQQPSLSLHLQDQRHLPLDSSPHPHDSLPPQSTSTQSQPEQQIMALSRQRFAQEMPTGKKLESVKQQMLRVHRASGHTSMQSLQRLLRARKAPPWAITLAGSLECPECRESGKPMPRPPASMSEPSKLYEILGTDVFDYTFKDGPLERKFKFILWRDRACGLTMVDLLKEFGGDTGIQDWQPTTEDIIASFTRWLMHNPSPSWLLTDAATYYSSMSMIEYLGRSGVGLTVAPAEAHWVMGPEESTIRVLKATVERLLREETALQVPQLFQLAASAHNDSHGPSGYSPFQWTRGAGSDTTLLGVDMNKAFGGLLKAKDRAKLAYEKEKAQEKYSKLNNSTGRPPMSFKNGQLVMLWRQRPRPGKMAGSWIGPMRLILQEGSTMWVSTGATLIRAKVNQLRSCTRREELGATLEGAAIYKEHVSVDTLLRDFSGRHYWDVSGDVPSLQQQSDNLQPTEVLVPSDPATLASADTWRLDESGSTRWLVRIHNLPRLQLFTLDRTTTCPVSTDEMTGRRVTIVRPLHGGERVEIRDDGEPRALQDRWVGETRFELFPRKSRKTEPKVANQGVKRTSQPSPVEVDTEPKDKQQKTDHSADNAEASNTLNQALAQQGPDVLDGIQPTNKIQGSSGSNSCVISECVLPGGHYGQHEDSQGRAFMWDPFSGRRDLEADDLEVESSDEELVPADVPAEDGGMEDEMAQAEEDMFVVMEIDVSKEELDHLGHLGHEKATVWLSKKMEAKGKEIRWQELSIDKKKEFDVAQAKELSNVMISKALRTLTRTELQSMDHRKVMQMRWVLTTKSSGLAKARLVILGFQAPNITEVESASPTMSKLSKHMLLSIAANCQFRIRAGDVTSAFLQTEASIEDEQLTVWAPSELAILYGADPARPVMPLRVVRAFYGLVHAPRRWFEDVQAQMRKQQWTQLLSDKCVFLLLQDGVLHGVAGLHVDDFIIAGNDSDPIFTEAEKKLRSTYDFGKWEFDDFEFAGTHISQSGDSSIHMDQKSYVEKWIEEIPLDKKRSQETKSILTPTEVTALRGALGSVSWKATQSGPQYLADVSLLLSEVNHATIETIIKTNKLVREIRKASDQRLTFHSWRVPLSDLTIVVWSDASNHNRIDKSSTYGLIAGIAPSSILAGEEVPISVLQWKSGRTPRQCLGSNGAEVQGITIGEDVLYHCRALLEFRGIVLTRSGLHQIVRENSSGALVMDSKGIYDAASRNVSSLHGLRNSRAGYELTLAMNQARSLGSSLRWVNGLAQLADGLTKWGARKTFLQFMAQGQRWRLMDDPKFTAGRKIHKRDWERQIGDRQNLFLTWIHKLAVAMGR